MSSEHLADWIERAGFPRPEAEYKFHPKRKWRFDLAWPDRMLAIECQGGIWTRGRHTRGKGYLNDCEKLNEGQLTGWQVLYVPADWFNNGAILPLLERIFHETPDCSDHTAVCSRR